MDAIGTRLYWTNLCLGSGADSLVDILESELAIIAWRTLSNGTRTFVERTLLVQFGRHEACANWVLTRPKSRSNIMP